MMSTRDVQLHSIDNNSMLDIPDDFPISASSVYNHTYDEVKRLGSGGYGRVFEVINRCDKKSYAVKKICINHHRFQQAYQEVKILSSLKHENIVGYVHTWVGFGDQSHDQFTCGQEDSQRTLGNEMVGNNTDTEDSCSPNHIMLFIVMELCFRTLRNYIDEQNSTREKAVVANCNLIRQISSGLEYIHKCGIVHRDIKPENIFVVGDSASKMSCRIGDFGLSTEDDKSPISYHSSGIGSHIYSAPEQRISHIYDNKVDVYSLGVVVLEMVFVIATKMELSKVVELYHRLGKLPHDFNQWIELREIIGSMLCINPLMRPTATDVRNSLEDFIDVRSKDNLLLPYCTGLFHPETNLSSSESSSAQSQTELARKDLEIAALRKQVAVQSIVMSKQEKEIQRLQLRVNLLNAAIWCSKREADVD